LTAGAAAAAAAAAVPLLLTHTSEAALTPPRSHLHPNPPSPHLPVPTVAGVLQEGKAEKATEAIKAMLSTSATVIRGGERTMEDALRLVPGDVVFCQSGDRLPADVRWVTISNLQVRRRRAAGQGGPPGHGHHARARVVRLVRHVTSSPPCATTPTLYRSWRRC
jgi:hypothetical protein